MFHLIQRTIFKRKLEAQIVRDRKEQEVMVQRAGLQVVRLYNQDSHAVALGLHWNVHNEVRQFLDELRDWPWEEERYKWSK